MKTKNLLLICFAVLSFRLYGQPPVDFKSGLPYVSEYIDDRKGVNPTIEFFDVFITFKPSPGSDSLFMLGLGRVESGGNFVMKLTLRLIRNISLPSAAWLHPGNENSFDSLSFEDLFVSANDLGCPFLETENEVYACLAYAAYSKLKPFWGEQVWTEGELTYWVFERKWFGRNRWVGEDLNTNLHFLNEAEKR